MTISSKALPLPGGAPLRSNRDFLHCRNQFSLTCVYHGTEITVPCGRWRTCPPCARRLQWKLRNRFLAGIEKAPPGLHPMFFTLTFPQAVDEEQAQKAWSSMVRRLRYRGMGEYGFVLQRTKRGTLHFHGIAHMPWFTDELAEWRRLLQASGFGIQNRLVIAEPSHAIYISRYISTRLANLSPLRRAYGFSRKFPQPEAVQKQKEEAALLAELGAKSECKWEPTVSVWARLR